MSLLTQFNTYTFESVGYVVTTSMASVFTLDDNSRYIIKSIRATNYSGTAADLTVNFYSGAQDASYLIEQDTIAASASVEVLVGGPLVLSGDLGDELRMSAGTTTAINVIITVMQLSKQTGL